MAGWSAIRFGELDELVLCYATTIHKFAGVRVPGGGHPHFDSALYDAQAQPDLYRQSTRGKTLVVLVGQKKALAMAVKAESKWEDAGRN